MPCDQCPIRNTCQAPCDALNAILPTIAGFNENRVHRRSAAKILTTLQRKAEANTLRAYADHALTPTQRRIFDLYYHTGLTHTQIAERLSIRRNTVAKSLAASRLRIGRWIKRGVKAGTIHLTSSQTTSSATMAAEAVAESVAETADSDPMATLHLHPSATAMTLPAPRLVGGSKRHKAGREAKLGASRGSIDDKTRISATPSDLSDSLQSIPRCADALPGEESARTA